MRFGQQSHAWAAASSAQFGLPERCLLDLKFLVRLGEFLSKLPLTRSSTTGTTMALESARIGYRLLPTSDRGPR
jgi:hypothetical protein